MNVFASFNPALRRNLWVLFTAGLLFWACLASLLPTLPIYIKETGASAHMVGIVMGAFAIGLIVSRGWLSRLADERGRKLVLLIGIVVDAVAPLGYILTDSVPVLIAIRAFHGLSISAFALAYSALVVDLAPPQQRGEVIGYMSLVNPIGMALGPAIGGFSYDYLGFTPMFLIATGLGVAGIWFTLQVQEPARSPEPSHAGQFNTSNPTTDLLEPTDKPEPNEFWGLLLSPRIQIPAIVLLLVGLTFGCLSTFLPLFIEETGAELNVGLFYTAAAVASFAIRLVVGPASDRFGRGVFISLSLVFYATAMILLWRANDAVSFLLAGVIEGAGSGTLIPMMAALMADRSNVNERGRTFGVCMLGFDGGIALAGPVLGAAATWIGYRGIFGICAGLACLGLLVFLTRSSKGLESSWRFALGMGRDLYAID